MQKRQRQIKTAGNIDAKKTETNNIVIRMLLEFYNM